MGINKIALTIYSRTKQANLAALQAVASGSTALLPRMALSGLSARKAKIGLQGLGAAEVGNMLLKAEAAKREMLTRHAEVLQKTIDQVSKGGELPAELKSLKPLSEINNINLHDIILDKKLRTLGEESVLANPVSGIKTLLGLD